MLMVVDTQNNIRFDTDERKTKGLVVVRTDDRVMNETIHLRRPSGNYARRLPNRNHRAMPRRCLHNTAAVW